MPSWWGALVGVKYEKLPSKEKEKVDANGASPSHYPPSGQYPMPTLGASKARKEEPHKPLATAVLSVKGMTCAACSSSVESALSAVAGVRKARVALLQETAEVEFEEGALQPSVLVEAIEDAGFDGGLISVKTSAKACPEVVKVQVFGMTCAACSGAVESSLLRIPGVTRAAVSLAQGEVEIHFDSTQATVEEVVSAVEDAGFEATVISQGGLEQCRLQVTGLTCGGCSSSCEKALLQLPGVSKAAVNFLTGVAEVWYNSNLTGPRDIIACVNNCGFSAALLQADSGQEHQANIERELAYWWGLFSSSLYFTTPVFLVAMLLPMIPAMEPLLHTMVMGFAADELIKWALATPVQFVIGWRFHAGAWKALKRGSANMDVLVALGTNASYVYSVVSILHHHFNMHREDITYVPTDFFETCAMLITFILLGKYLECAAKGKTSEALTKLLRLVPDVAVVVTMDEAGHVVGSSEVPSGLIHKGDLLKVLPGGKVPTDGTIVDGQSYMDEAMITGESEPVWKRPGDPVIGGTLNTSNMLIIKATRVGSETVLSQIVTLVEHAQLAKAPVQAFADRVAAIFVPVVVALALLTWAAWFISGEVGAYPLSWLPLGHTVFLFALLFGIAVVVIACPCAMGLATPTAVMVGTGVAASMGILIKGADALEKASKVDTVIFDKTGTLTLGRPTVAEARLFDDRLAMAQLCACVGAAESTSEHPLARALLRYCAEQVSKAGSALASRPGSGAVDPGSGKPLRKAVTGGSSSGAIGSSSRQSSFSNAAGAAAAAPGAGGSAPGGPLALGSTNADLQAATVGLFPRPYNVQVAPGLGITCRVQLEGEGAAPAARPAAPAPSSLPKVSSTSSLSAAGTAAQFFLPGASSGGSRPVTPGAAAPASSSSAPPAQQQLLSGEVSVAVGNRALMYHEGVRLGDAVEDYMRELEARGHTCVLVALNDRLAGVMAVSDPVKPEAVDVVAGLKAQGVGCCLLTGDNWRTARAIASVLDIHEVHAEVLPATKANKVKELQAAGHVVAMVGDGINDSPALAAADLGMAIGSGTDIAIEAADYVLMRDDLMDVLVALDVSRRTFGRIKLNYWWAMGYNVLLIPIAAGVLYPAFRIQMPPWIAGACMAFSSVSVVVSSLTLRYYRKPTVAQLKRGRGGRGPRPNRNGYYGLSDVVVEGPHGAVGPAAGTGAMERQGSHAD